MQPLVLGPVSVSTRTLTGQGIGFLETLKNPVNLFKNNLNNTRNNMKSQIQNKQKKNSGIVELLIPTLNKIIRNQNTYFVVTMNNRLKITSVHMVLPLKYGRIFCKKSFSWGDKNFFGQKNYGEVVLNWMANDQIMPSFRRSFINDKCLFH